MVEREERYNPAVVPRAAEAKASLSKVRDWVQSINWDDSEKMKALRTCAREALEALGFGLPDGTS